MDFEIIIVSFEERQNSIASIPTRHHAAVQSSVPLEWGKMCWEKCAASTHQTRTAPSVVGAEEAAEEEEEEECFFFFLLDGWFSAASGLAGWFSGAL